MELTRFVTRALSRFAIAGAVVVAACAPDTALDVAAPGSASVQARTGWRFNSQKYRDAGIRPATGRSGSAALSAEALIDPSGAITLAVTSYKADDAASPAGSIEKVQVKIFGSAGQLLATRNYVTLAAGSTWTTPLTGLPAGGTVQVQANVRGIDLRRTDVVTVSNIVPAIAPDLAVTALVLPRTAITGVPTVLGATVAELGGQHGARADCVLYIDGVAADRSRNIWVDAGDAVTCAFTHVFALAGTPSIRVALERVQPFDGRPSNNSAAGSLVVAAPLLGGPSSIFNGYVTSGTFTAADTFETTWTAPDGSLFLQQRTGSATSGTQLIFNITGVIGATVSFPLTRVDLAENADGRLLASMRMDAIPATSVSPGAACAISDDPATGATLYLCTYDLGFTVVTLEHHAGTVTYQSTDYSKTWNGSSYDENTYVVNATTTTGASASIQGVLDLTLQVTDGATLYVLNGSAPMAPASVTDVQPRQCVDSPVSIPPVTYATRTCFGSSYVFNGFQGTMSGAGITAQP